MRAVGRTYSSASDFNSAPARPKDLPHTAHSKPHSPGHLEQVFHVFCVAGSAFGAPHEPQFEDVVVSAALDDLVARVVADVVLFVLLEQVVGAHLVAAH